MQKRSCALLLYLLFTAPSLLAAEEPRWSMSTVLGGHLPNLAPLNDGLYKAPMIGEATVLVYEGGLGTTADGEVIDENITEVQAFRFDNPVPDVGVAPQAGIEFQWHASSRNSLIIGFGSMEKASINQVVGNLPMQQYFVSNEVVSKRRDKISYTEYTLGWRYNFFRQPKLKLYTRLSLHEVFDIDFREDFAFEFVKSPIQDLVGVRRVMVVQAQTAALLMGQVGVGAEWFIRDWFSLGFEGGLVVGERDFLLKDVVVRDDFGSGDGVSRNGMPYMAMSDGSLGYLSAGATAEDVASGATRESYYRPMLLRFDGFRFMFRFSLYF